MKQLKGYMAWHRYNGFLNGSFRLKRHLVVRHLANTYKVTDPKSEIASIDSQISDLRKRRAELEKIKPDESPGYKIVEVEIKKVIKETK